MAGVTPKATGCHLEPFVLEEAPLPGWRLHARVQHVSKEDWKAELSWHCQLEHLPVASSAWWPQSSWTSYMTAQGST